MEGDCIDCLSRPPKVFPSGLTAALTGPRLSDQATSPLQAAPVERMLGAISRNQACKVGSGSKSAEGQAQRFCLRLRCNHWLSAASDMSGGKHLQMPGDTRG